jgi:Na+/H+ antiporter NhaD/arsenite permease-like protein
MVDASNAVNTGMWLAGGILVLSYAMIFTEYIHRTSAAIIGAVVMVGVGTAAGFYSQEAAVQAIDANTMLLLLGMMILVALMHPTGGFEYLAIRIAKTAGNNPRLLLIYLGFAVSVLSMVLNNVTTIMVFAPLTMLITRMLHLNPAPYLLAEAILSNISGISTLIGDPPNIMIGSAANFDFITYFSHMAPIILPTWLSVIALLLILFRRSLAQSIMATSEIDLDETKAIKDIVSLRRILFALAVVLILFVVHHHLHLYPAFVAIVGLAMALLLVRPDIEKIVYDIEWSVLLFFTALFVLVGGVEASGLLDVIGNAVGHIADDPNLLLFAALATIWVSAFLSAIVDNIPFTVTMIPIIAGLANQGINIEPLWWALAVGVGLGGNATHIGSTANIICMEESRHSGVPEGVITPAAWLKTGLPVIFVSLIIASFLFTLFFALLR